MTTLPSTGVADKGLQVPYSAGRARPTIAVPPGACDCHHHIYDPVRHPYAPDDVRNQPPATVDAYRMLQSRLGLTRNVVVQPSAYGTDNACTLEALGQFGKEARAIVVVDASITAAELTRMHELGVRGVRFNISTGGTRDSRVIRSLARRIADLGWSGQFWMSANDTVQLAGLLDELPSRIVFDHRAHLPQPEGVAHPAFEVVRRLIDKGRTWVKLSGLYLDSKAGDPAYDDTLRIGRAFVELAPERMLWGTDWPHPSIFSERKPWPDDARMLDQLAEQAPDETTRRKILVDNPAELYGFT